MQARRVAKLLMLSALIYITALCTLPLPSNTVAICRGPSRALPKAQHAAAPGAFVDDRPCYAPPAASHAVARATPAACKPQADGQARTCGQAVPCGAPVLPGARCASTPKNLGTQPETYNLWTTETALRRVLPVATPWPATTKDTSHLADPSLLPSGIGIGVLAERLIHLVNNSKETKPKAPACVEPV